MVEFDWKMSDQESPENTDNGGKIQSRPVSRRGIKETFQNVPSSAGSTNMQPSSNKFASRPPSTQGFPKRNASRLSSGIMQPPKTGQPILGIANPNVLDRPITQQGVTGLRTATSRGPQFRQVLDKRYYEGIIRMKMKDIASEVARLNGEIELESQQQATSQVYEKRVREVASELTTLQGQLADYNLVVDKVNTSTDKSQIDEEAGQIINENERLVSRLDELFAQNRFKEDEIHQLENEIQNEKDVTFKLIQQMTENDRNKYEELKNINEKLQKEIEQHQQQLDLLTNQKLEYEDRISGSQIKQETVRLYHKLGKREERKAALLEEEKTRSTPAQEREKLLQKVKEDNAEMAAIERQINQINEQIKKKKEELEMIEQDLEDSQSDRHQKFKELKKREETMEQFLSTFDDSKKTETQRIEELEEKIVKALEQMSKNLLGSSTLPSHDEFYLMKENLTLRQEELEKSKLTLEELNKKQGQLTGNMKKVDELEKKIQEEMSTIQEKMITMSDELKTLVNLDSLRDKAREKRNRLTDEREELLSKVDALTRIKTELEKENTELTKELNENETYIQLNNLERKLQVLEQNNNSIKEFTEQKKIEMDYQPLKNEALKILNEYNQLLITSYSK